MRGRDFSLVLAGFLHTGAMTMPGSDLKKELSTAYAKSYCVASWHVWPRSCCSAAARKSSGSDATMTCCVLHIAVHVGVGAATRREPYKQQA